MEDKKELKDDVLKQTSGGYINEPDHKNIYIRGLEAIGPYATGGNHEDKNIDPNTNLYFQAEELEIKE